MKQYENINVINLKVYKYILQMYLQMYSNEYR